MSCIHRGPYVQRGRGFGSTISSWFKKVIPAAQLMGKKILESPITQNILKTAKRSAIDAGLNVATDALEGKKIKESLNENVATAKKAVSDAVLSAIKKVKSNRLGGDVAVVEKKKRLPTKKAVVISVGKKKRKNKYRDIFD